MKVRQNRDPKTVGIPFREVQFTALQTEPTRCIAPERQWTHGCKCARGEPFEKISPAGFRFTFGFGQVSLSASLIVGNRGEILPVPGAKSLNVQQQRTRHDVFCVPAFRTVFSKVIGQSKDGGGFWLLLDVHQVAEIHEAL